MIKEAGLSWDCEVNVLSELLHDQCSLQFQDLSVRKKVRLCRYSQ